MSTTHSHHHRHIDESQLLQNTELLFKQGRHDVQNLADLLISFSKHRGSSLSELQKHALRSFHAENIYDLREYIHIPIQDVIPAYFVLFDDLFFFGSLSEHCELAIDREKSLDSGRRGQMITITCEKEVKAKNGVFGMIERRFGEKKCVIVLHSHRQEFPARYAMLKRYVETLLHEMSHAFFELWACGYSECVDGYDKLGKTKHGRLWQDVALALENAVRDRRFLNLDLCLDRVMALALELVTMDEKVEKEDLERWTIKYEELAEAIAIVYGRQGEDNGSGFSSGSQVIERRKPSRRVVGPATLIKGMEILGSKFFQ